MDVCKNYEKVDMALVEKFAKLEESASINECLKENGALQHDFRPVWPGIRSCGRAFTVLARAGDNLILHKAITMLQPGDFLVVACDGFQESGGMWGGIMSTAALTMGCVGMVIDGCVRDTMLMKKVGFNVWSRGISVKRSTKIAPGKINVPIIIGNVSVNPGDLIFADNDAVVVVPREQALSVYELAAEREAKEDKSLEIVLKDGTYTFLGNQAFKTEYDRLRLEEE
ncbi:MAG: RraA family protein [Oscillospiraceae bacterium]